MDAQDQVALVRVITRLVASDAVHAVLREYFESKSGCFGGPVLSSDPSGDHREEGLSLTLARQGLRIGQASIVDMHVPPDRTDQKVAVADSVDLARVR